ncbi:MAG: SUMF1/EgtB/PvdO family nonheme iron enzyme [Thermodesulfobacteriota bacterium]
MKAFFSTTSHGPTGRRAVWFLVFAALIGCSGSDSAPESVSFEKPAEVDNSGFYGKYKVDLEIGAGTEETFIATIGGDPNFKGQDGYFYIPAAESSAAYTVKDREVAVNVDGNTVAIEQSGTGWTYDLVLEYSAATGGIVISGNADADDPLEPRGTISGSAVKVEETADWIDGDYVNTLGMTYMKIPAGEFTMGSPTGEGGRYVNETQHPVRLTRNFYLQTTEVTQEQWRTVMGYSAAGFAGCGVDCPVESVSWNDAREFIAQLGTREGRRYRLPTEAEWEYAARANGTEAFPNGDISHIGTGRDPRLNVIGWYAYNSNRMTRPVGMKMPNAWGLYDMHGNVQEWCEDWQDEYPNSSALNPIGPSSGVLRILRGGAWNSRSAFCRSAYRSAAEPSERSDGNGFRTIVMFPPAATIINPVSGSEHRYRGSVSFQASAEDAEDGKLSGQKLVWQSDMDGRIGTGSFFQTAALSKGVHTITLTVSDSDGQKTVDTTTITISSHQDTVTNEFGMAFILVSPGSFMMGSPPDEPGRKSDEISHQVTLTKDYYLQKTEVTQGQWRMVMGANPSRFYRCGDDCPVESVSWDDAQAFIAALNGMTTDGSVYRLPSEAEWEYAARSASVTAFANGNITHIGSGFDQNLDLMGWYIYNSQGQIHPVGLKQANEWGFQDMHGNVMEWCQDWMGKYSPYSITDPAGPSAGTLRVMRGGNMTSDASNCRSATRLSAKPERRSDTTGLRLVLVPAE